MIFIILENYKEKTTSRVLCTDKEEAHKMCIDFVNEIQADNLKYDTNKNITNGGVNCYSVAALAYSADDQITQRDVIAAAWVGEEIEDISARCLFALENKFRKSINGVAK